MSGAGRCAAGHSATGLPRRIAVAAAELAGMNRERWRQRAQRASDAFGLVLLLVLITYVLASVISNRGWAAVLLTIVTSATSVVAPGQSSSGGL